MIIKNDQQLKTYQEATKLSTQIHDELRQAIKPGKTALEIDQLADRLCQKHQVRPNFKGVGPKKNRYQHATCISVNDAVVHGIPDNRPFKEGDVVKVDFGLVYQGLNTDHCFCVGVGQLSEADRKLVQVTREAILSAANLAVTGNRVGDLGYAMQSTANRAGFSVAKEFVGHGIGHSLHDEPQIPAYGRPHQGQELKKGMVLCVEAQVMAGDDCVYIDDDGWTVKTCDGKKSAMFEYMVVVGDKKPIFLTPTQNWPIISGA